MAPTEFRWIDWNLEQATKHGCTVDEVESVVRNAGRGFPRKMSGKWFVQGRGIGGRMIEVFYLIDDDEVTAFVVHAMPVTTRRRRGGR
jgi:hypothetical protein